MRSPSTSSVIARAMRIGIRHFRWSLISRSVVVAAVLVMGVAVGCGPPPTSGVVRGRVSVGDRPLSGGVIGFHSTQDAARWSAGQIAVDGTYLVPDAPLGPCAVTIDTSMLKDRPRFSDAAATTGPTPGGLPGGSGVVAQEPEYVPIRKQFSNVDQSPLSATVMVGANSFDFGVE